jgi:DNA polymerase
MLYLDTETYSECDLKKTGGYRYAQHPTTRVTLFGYAIDDSPAKVWDVTTGSDMPTDLREALDDDNHLVLAHNSMFDRPVIQHTLNIVLPMHRWRDSMVKAYTLGLPGSLAQLGQALGLSDDQAKMSDGHKLVMKFCKPAPSNHKAFKYDKTTHPAEWERFVEYCAQDVEAMRTIWKLMPDFNDLDHEIDLWHLDQEINDRGMPIDLDTVAIAIERVAEEKKHLTAELVALTNGILTSSAAVTKLVNFLEEHEGLTMPSLAKADVSAVLLRDDITDRARRILEIRQQADKTSVKKYNTLALGTCEDGRLRGTLQFYGANRTGRWAGRLFQPQNLARPTIGDLDVGVDHIRNNTLDLAYDYPMEALSSCVRAMICAPKGMKLVVTDLASIEARVLPWLAGDEKTLDVFRSGKDIYKHTASGIYNKDYSDIDSEMRFVGKVAALALGFQGGVNAFMSMGKNYGVDIDETLASDTVRNYRRANKRIVGLWHTMNNGAMDVIDRTQKCKTVGKLLINIEDDWLTVRLPSGRKLAYYKPLNEDHDNSGRFKTTFMGVGFNRKWQRIDTYGGKLVENITQAVARDVLAANLPLIEAAGYEIVATVHDEVVTLCPDEEQYSSPALSALLSTSPSWADGLPLDAKGFEGMRYSK